jgi:protein TonB
MAHAHAATLHLPLDAKRIVATAAVIALHVAVLMMLMMPAQVAQAPAAEEAPPVPPDRRVVIPEVIPPPKPLPIPQRAQPPQRTQVAIPETMVEPVDQNVSPVDVAMPELPDVPTTFDPGPATATFVQLATRVAPPPAYPRRAIALQITGVVRLRIHVDASGKPLEVTVEESSGHAMLDEAAVRTVQSRWRFVPATRDGQAVDAWALVPIEFVLQ